MSATTDRTDADTTLSPNATTPLALIYDVTPSPTVIRVSPAGGNPNHVDLNITVSPPFSSVHVKSIEITIPVGGNGPPQLSSAKDLPSPVYDRTGRWKIYTTGSKVKIEPVSGSDAIVTEAITCTLPAVSVNEATGNVVVTATEFTPQGSKRGSETIAELNKVRSDMPVLEFYVDPPTITRLKTPVTFYWKCTPEGQKRFVFRVHSNEQDHKYTFDTGDCIGDADQCLLAAAGVSGVDGPKIDSVLKIPTFVLEIIETDSSGDRVVWDTLEVTPTVRAPWFEPEHHAESYLSGRIQRLFWEAHDAARCTLTMTVGNKQVAYDVPADTLDNGYLVYAGDPTRTSQTATLTAYGTDPKAIATLEFNLAVGRPLTRVKTTGANALGLGITSDNRHVVATYIGSSVGGTPGMRIIDTQTAAVVQSVVSGSLWYLAVANIASAPVALTLHPQTGRARVFNLSSFPVPPSTEITGSALIFCMGLSVSRDGMVALATGWNMGGQPIDVRARKGLDLIRVKTTESGGLTPDGKRALFTDYDTRVLTVVPLATPDQRSTIDLKPIVPPRPKLAEAPDVSEVAEQALGDPMRQMYAMSIRVSDANSAGQTLALIGIPIANKIAVANLDTMQLEPEAIPVGNVPIALEVSPAGDFALVANYKDGTVGVVDIRNRTMSATTIPCDGAPRALAISADGTMAAIANEDGTIILI